MEWCRWFMLLLKHLVVCTADVLLCNSGTTALLVLLFEKLFGFLRQKIANVFLEAPLTQGAHCCHDLLFGLLGRVGCLRVNFEIG